MFSDGNILTKYDAATLLAALVEVCKLKGHYACQGYRMGGGTSYSKRKFPDNLIKHTGRWSSNAFQTYIRYDHDYMATLPFRALLSPIEDPMARFGYNK